MMKKITDNASESVHHIIKIVKWKSYYINDERLKKMFHLKFP